MILGTNIKRARMDRRLTQSELGRMVGVDQAGISLYERGRIDIPITRLILLSRALRVPLMTMIRMTPMEQAGRDAKMLETVDSLMQAREVLERPEVRKILDVIDRIAEKPEVPCAQVQVKEDFLDPEMNFDPPPRPASRRPTRRAPEVTECPT